jgi:multimeric flavodoxin WrbA
MEIVCVLGSPRPKGNSTTIAKRFCDRAEKMGAKVQYFHLNEMNYRGCQGCFGCKTKSDRCVLEDDLTQVLDAIRETDILVMATSVYFAAVTGQLKCFLDRTFSYMVPDFRTNPNPSRLSLGKKAVFISAQGAPEDMFAELHTQYKNYFKRYGFEESHFIRGCNMRELGDAEAREDIMALAEKTAEKMMS